MTLPNFLIVGAGRSGTTSLYNYLDQHPDVYMSPVKETNFFAHEALVSGSRSAVRKSDGSWPIKTVAAYRKLFADVTHETAVGEASPSYLFVPGVAEHIRRHLPAAKLIVILRDPIDRAFSSYMKYVRDGIEKRTFTEALRHERLGIRQRLPLGCHAYLEIGFYHKHLTTFWDCFDAGQIRIYLFEDLSSDGAGLMADLFRFLGVDVSFAPDVSIRHNISGVPRSRSIDVLTRKRPWKTAIRPYLPRPIVRHLDGYFATMRGRNLVQSAVAPEIRADLIELYRNDVVKLQGRIGRNLTHWLKPKPAPPAEAVHV